MSWVETESLSFRARHDERDRPSAERMLDALEDLRLDLEDRFEEVAEDIAVVVHSSPFWLGLAHPYLPLARRAAGEPSRRYLTGWATGSELHVLSDRQVRAAARSEEVREPLVRTSERLYAQQVVARNATGLPPPWGPVRFLRYLRWAWLVEGAGQYFSGQTGLFRPAVSRRMREGGPPSFPPGARDAPVLGGTVFELLEEEVGPEACVRLVSHLRKDRERALEIAFDAPVRRVEEAWRGHLARIA